MATKPSYEVIKLGDLRVDGDKTGASVLIVSGVPTPPAPWKGRNGEQTAWKCIGPTVYLTIGWGLTLDRVGQDTVQQYLGPEERAALKRDSALRAMEAEEKRAADAQRERDAIKVLLVSGEATTADEARALIKARASNGASSPAPAPAPASKGKGKGSPEGRA